MLTVLSKCMCSAKNYQKPSKRSTNYPKNIQKLSKNDPKTIKKRSHGPFLDGGVNPKPSPGETQVKEAPHKLSNNYRKTIKKLSKLSKNHPKTIQKPYRRKLGSSRAHGRLRRCGHCDVSHPCRWAAPRWGGVARRATTLIRAAVQVNFLNSSAGQRPVQAGRTVV